jgi:hypothetical protein
VRFAHQKGIEAVQAANTSRGGIRLPSLEACRQKPSEEAPNPSFIYLRAEFATA